MQNAGTTSRSGLTATDPVPWSVRVPLFLIAGTSGAALLAKVYGLTSMRTATLAIATPCCLALAAVWLWSIRTSHQLLAAILSIGFIGGLAGTIAYDVVRVPFHLMGQRVFAPIDAYGIWISDAGMSSRFTDVIGWTYHFSNGITFGIMYALLFLGRGWWWAVAWGLVLESIALASPFARIFSLTGNYSAIAIAYAGHIAWGIPLGLLVQHWAAVRSWIGRTPLSLKLSAVAVAGAAIAWPILSPANIERDRSAMHGEFRAEGDVLRPEWLRIQRGESIRVFNPGVDSIWVRAKGQDLRIGSEQRETIQFAHPGVYQVFIETPRQSRSSFVIVDPVEDVI